MGDVLEQIQGRAEHDPFNTIFVSFTQCLPYCLLFWRLSGDAYPSPTAIRAWGVLLYFTELNTFGRYIVSGIGEVEHTPKRRVWIRFGNLEEREICRVG